MSNHEEPETLRVDPSHALRDLGELVMHAVDALEGDGTVIVPTDTVYGVAARLDRPAALLRLFDLKDRDRSKPLAVLVADPAQGRGLVDLERLDDASRSAVDQLMAGAWPGALTLVLPRATAVLDRDLGGSPTTIGIRCPQSAIVRAIAERVGPLVTTSANRSGTPTPTTASAAARSLAGSVALVIDDGPCTEPPSTVLDMTSTPFRLLRVGSVDVAAYGLDQASFVAPDGTGRSGG